MKKIKYITLGFVIIYIIYEVIRNLPYVIQGISNTILWLSNIFAPLISGCIIAFLLLPMVKYFEKLLGKIRFKKNKQFLLTGKNLKLRRMISLVLSIAIITCVIFSLIYGTYIMIGGTLNDFSIEETWEYIKESAIQYQTIFKNVEITLEKLGISSNYVEMIENLSSAILESIQNFAESLAQKTGDIGKSISNFFFGSIFAVYIIINREYLSNLYENLLRLTLSERRSKMVKGILFDINKVLLGFIRGKVIDLTLLGIVTSLSLMIAGFEFAFMVGMFAGYTNIVPYLGSWLGALPVVFVSLADGGLQQGIFGYFYILAVQQVYITFVTPKIQGDSVGIHPIFVLLSLTVFSKIFGLLGMILAIPLAGITQIFIIRWVEYRKNKKGIELIDVNDKEKI